MYPSFGPSNTQPTKQIAGQAMMYPHWRLRTDRTRRRHLQHRLLLRDHLLTQEHILLRDRVHLQDHSLQICPRQVHTQLMQ